MNEELVHGLLDINHMMRKLYEGKASQSRILIILYEQKEINQKKLTEILGIQPGSVSEILAKLEKAELIHRIPGKEDHRTLQIRLTKQGEIRAIEAIERRKERHEQMFACLTQEEKENLLQLLSKLSLDWQERFSFTDKRM